MVSISSFEFCALKLTSDFVAQISFFAQQRLGLVGVFSLLNIIKGFLFRASALDLPYFFGPVAYPEKPCFFLRQKKST